MKTSTAHPSRARAFTLVEILISMALIGFVGVICVAFLRQALTIYFYDSGRIRINRDIRSFTEEMATNAVFSSYFMIFPNFSTRTTTTNNVTLDAGVVDGQSGDFVVLIYTSPPDATTGKSYINKVVGYYRDVQTTGTQSTDPTAPIVGTGPVRKFVITGLNYDPTANVAPISTLLNTYMPTTNTSTNPIVVQLAQGLADGKLFYDFQDKSVLIRGQIIEQGTVTRRAVNTYNFAVTPRN
jgi:hypothetical protein